MPSSSKVLHDVQIKFLARPGVTLFKLLLQIIFQNYYISKRQNLFIKVAIFTTLQNYITSIKEAMTFPWACNFCRFSLSYILVLLCYRTLRAENEHERIIK